jgi:radical SAM protein with 4Fe4S-binding SPASM domain
LNEFLSLKKDEFFLLYSPLSTIATIATKKEVEKINSALGGESADEQLKEVILALLDVCPAEKAFSKRIRNTSGFVNLSLLLNNSCNFNCSYCYSASGRSSTEMEESKLIAALDYFIDRKRTTVPGLSLSFLGGGEPMISKRLIRKAVSHANQLAKENDFELWFKIVTNGSLLQKEDIKIIKENNIEITVSYEILEEIQNLQRKNYDKVTQNIKTLVKEGVMISINSVITPYNVHRQTEMVNEVKKYFPPLDYLSFEPLMELNEWATGTIDSVFYNDFTNHFIEARNIAEKNDIELSCSLLRNIDCTVERYCAGEFAVCPDGSITVCPCVSSPDMPNYKDYLYGKIDESGRIEIDENKLSKLLAEDVYAYPECKDCFAKWNCGGGCINTNKQDNKKRKRERCDFVRDFTKKIIWERVKANYEEESGKTIMEILDEAIV